MYDAIVIGARCAGSPTAMLLARKGYRVLLVDKAGFPSDTLSTHIIWPHGAELLDRWGLLARLAATGCPPIARQMIFDLGPFALRGGVTESEWRTRRLLPQADRAGQATGRRRGAGRCGTARTHGGGRAQVGTATASAASRRAPPPARQSPSEHEW